MVHPAPAATMAISVWLLLHSKLDRGRQSQPPHLRFDLPGDDQVA